MHPDTIGVTRQREERRSQDVEVVVSASHCWRKDVKRWCPPAPPVYGLKTVQDCYVV